MTKLDWSKFEPLFGTWSNKIKTFFDRGGFDPIYTFLKAESQRGIAIAPLSSIVYKAFKETHIDSVNCVLISYCPYHTFVNNQPIADGIAFSCGVNGKIQPFLEKILEGWENEIYNGMALDREKLPDLTYLAKNGVLLLNCALTVAKEKPGSHQDIWEPFTRFILEEVLAYTCIPIIFIGKDAQKYEKYVTPLTHGHIFSIEHPSFAVKNQQPWNTKGIFNKINEILKQNNRYEINWLPKISDKFQEDEIPF